MKTEIETLVYHYVVLFISMMIFVVYLRVQICYREADTGQIFYFI